MLSNVEVIFYGRLITNKYFITQEYISNGDKMDKGTRKRKAKKRDCFIAYDHIRKQYNTEQIMKELNVSKSENKKLSDLIKSFKGEN